MIIRDKQLIKMNKLNNNKMCRMLLENPETRIINRIIKQFQKQHKDF